MIELTCGILVSIGMYLILENNFIRKVFGIVVLSTAINIVILACGRLNHATPAFISSSSVNGFANPLPQALILTAIVIGFGLLAFLCAVIKALMADHSIFKQKS